MNVSFRSLQRLGILGEVETESKCCGKCKIAVVANLSAKIQGPPAEAHSTSACGGTRLKGFVAEDTAECPLVSVITAVFKGQPYIADCLESVLSQDYPNIEHIVLDGGSNDGTVEELCAYSDRIALWRSQPDLGVYDAWNKGLREARGEWICFLGVDDQFLPGAVRAYMDLAALNPDAEYLSSQVQWVHPSGYSRTIGRPWNWKGFSKWMCTAHVGSMHRRRLYERLGPYDVSYRSGADYELLLRARHQLNAAYMPNITVMMRAGGVSDCKDALAEAKRAKIISGGRNPVLATVEFLIANAKLALRPLRKAVGTFMNPNQ
jgi:glycosyltransferase involved in cell wall biosynthesis